MYEASSKNQDQFWLNVSIMILIAGLFVAGLYYYQEKQLTEVRKNIKNLETKLATLTTTSPTSNSSATEVKINQKKIITSGAEDLPRIALTFDADMNSGMSKREQWYDPKIIEMLKEKEVPATFFLTGMWAETYPKVAKQLANNNLFEIENHSYQTKAFSQPCYGLSPLTSKKEKTEAVEKAQQTIKGVTGETPDYFRFPGGCHQKKDLKLVNDLCLKGVQWSVVSGDAFAENGSSIVRKTLNNTYNGSIVVLHLGGPNAPHTAEALKEIIPELRNKGFKLTTLWSLLNPPSVPPIK